MATASSFPSDLAVPYWDVAPSLVREPYRETLESVRLSVLGDPGGEVSFVSTNPDVARVEGGVLHFGGTPGAAVITAEAVREGAVRSRRYIQVDVVRETRAGGLDWQPSGYVEQLPDGTWHFYYFSGWYDEDGSNIRVTGELAAEVFLDRGYLLRFDVWGEIESVDAPWYDTLELYVDWSFMRRFNPSEDVNGGALEPYVVPRRTEIVDLSMFTGRTVRLRFLWDTRDGLFQKFEGWFVSGVELVPVRGL